MSENEAKTGERPERKGAKTAKKELSAHGEEAAARYLVRHGYEILARNWRCYAGEVDIVAREGDYLVFCNVKTRMDDRTGYPDEPSNIPARRAKFEKIALAFVADYEEVGISVRFDEIHIVVVASDRAMIRHLLFAYSCM